VGLQVVALQLGKGHTATAICCVRLPSSSITALHNLPGQPPSEKEFVVVASYVTQGKIGQSPKAGAQGTSQGLLSVFEVCIAATAGAAAGPASSSTNHRFALKAVLA